MKRMLRNIALLACIGSLSACGFQLRGLSTPLSQSAPLSFTTLHVAKAGSLQSALQTALRRDGRIQFEGIKGTADAVLSIVDEEDRKDVLGVSLAGDVNEYMLIYSVTATVQRLQDEVPLRLTVTQRRTMSYSDSVTLGKEREEQLLRADMRKEAADQLVRRLGYLPVAGSKADAGKQP
ncbi:LPS assembly lipoprotein LptE [Vogesella oryzae]|uniref:LPS-assembly lipoprotein LptE n=1 Tax=Vogesella oryzae TaxID=1735285 RepID=UPI0015829D84|nr:LPS assembly lipoprotein LptE [Vogesella oryzae]